MKNKRTPALARASSEIVGVWRNCLMQVVHSTIVPADKSAAWVAACTIRACAKDEIPNPKK